MVALHNFSLKIIGNSCITCNQTTKFRYFKSRLKYRKLPAGPPLLTTSFDQAIFNVKSELKKIINEMKPTRK